MSTKSELQDLEFDFALYRQRCLNYEKRLELLEQSFTRNRNETHQKLVELKLQIQCAAKTGHKFEFDRRKEIPGLCNGYTDKTCSVLSSPVYRFVFVCRECGLEIEKRKSELTLKERKALIDLGVLEKPQPKSKPKKKSGGMNERNTPKPKCN